MYSMALYAQTWIQPKWSCIRQPAFLQLIKNISHCDYISLARAHVCSCQPRAAMTTRIHYWCRHERVQVMNVCLASHELKNILKFYWPCSSCLKLTCFVNSAPISSILNLTLPDAAEAAVVHFLVSRNRKRLCVSFNRKWARSKVTIMEARASPSRSD